MGCGALVLYHRSSEMEGCNSYRTRWEWGRASKDTCDMPNLPAAY